MSSNASAPQPQITRASDERVASNATNGINILIDLLYYFLHKSIYFYLFLLASNCLRNVHGKTRCLATERAYRSVGSKLHVTITLEDGRPTGPNCHHFVNEIGFVVRTFAPLEAEIWSAIPASDTNILIDCILVHIFLVITTFFFVI